EAQRGRCAASRRARLRYRTDPHRVRTPTWPPRSSGRTMPDEPEAMGLLALMLLTDARRNTRTSPGGALVLLADQDRSLWNRDLIAEGQAMVRACLRRNQPCPTRSRRPSMPFTAKPRTPPAPTGALRPA